LIFVFRAEQAAALEFGDDQVDEVVQTDWYIWKHHVEAIASIGKQPLFHLVGDGLRGSREGEAAVAAGYSGQLADCQVVSPYSVNDALAATLALIGFRNFRQQSVQVEFRCVRSEAIDSEPIPLSG
jgi:hypothetical protein